VPAAPLAARLWARLPALLAGGMALAFLGCLLAATEGHFVPQVVDLYVVCQYARAFAEGHPFQYNPGEPPSGGATSLLHTLLLAAAHVAGLRGEALVAFAIGLGALLYFASVALAGRLARRLAADGGGDGAREGRLAAVLVALGGPVVWGFFYGSDIALFMALTLLVALAFVSDWEHARAASWAVPAALLALARPEGLPLGLLLGAAWAFGPGRRATRAQRCLAALPAATGLALLGLMRTLTGSFVGSSLADKSLVAAYGWAGSLALVCEYAVDVLRGLLLGFYPSQAPVGFARGWASLAFPPLGLLLVLLALARPGARDAAPLRVVTLAGAAVAALTLPNVFMGVHFNRYVLWLFPLLLALVAVGLGRLARGAARGDARLDGALFAAGAGLLGLLGLLSTLRFAAQYGEMAGELWRRDVAAAEWIRAHLPPGTPIANVATSVEYLTGHRNLNLHGVTSPAFFGNTRAEREAGTFEALGRLPREERPAYLLTSVATQEGSVGLRALEGGPPVFRSLSLGDELLLLPLRWDAVERPARPWLEATLAATQGLREVDRLNVCDRRDERDHDYAFRSSLRGLPLHGTVRSATYAGAGEPLADAGRVILGSETFTLLTRPGRDLLLVMRTAREAQAAVLRPAGTGLATLHVEQAGVVLSVDGREAARAALAPADGWDEWRLRVPGSAIKGERSRFELRGRYASFRYWAYQ
jgi:hypothetical protein